MITKEEMIALRNAKAEIEDRYTKAKYEAFNNVVEKMCETKQGYTTLQISADTGLSVPCIASTLHRDCAIRRDFEVKTIRMVALDDEGVPNMAKIFKRKKLRAIWSVPENGYYMKKYEEKHKPTAPKEDTKSSIGGAMVKAMIEKYSG